MYYDTRDELMELGFSCSPHFGLDIPLYPLLETKGVATKQLLLLRIGEGVVLKILPILCSYRHIDVDCSRSSMRGFYEDDTGCHLLLKRSVPCTMYPEREGIVAMSMTEEILLSGISPNITAVYSILYCPCTYTSGISRCSRQELECIPTLPSSSLMSGYRNGEYSDASITIASEKLDYDFHDLLFIMDDEEVITSAFQIFWTLWRLRKYYGVFRHNDLGPGNILAKKENTVLDYKIEETYSIATSYVMKLWDFDKVTLPESWWDRAKTRYTWCHIYPDIDAPSDEEMLMTKTLELRDVPIFRIILDSGIRDGDSIFHFFIRLANEHGYISPTSTS